MDIVLAPHDEVDVRVGTPVAQLRAHLEAVGRPELARAPLWSGGRRLSLDHCFGTAPLVPGAHIVAIPPGSPWRWPGPDIAGARASTHHLAVLSGPCEGWVIAPNQGWICSGPGTAHPHLPRLTARRRGPWWTTSAGLVRPGRTFEVAGVRLQIRPAPGPAPRGRRWVVLAGLAVGVLVAVVTRNPLFALLGLTSLAGLAMTSTTPATPPAATDAAGVALAAGETTTPAGLTPKAAPDCVCRESTHVSPRQLNVQLAAGCTLPIWRVKDADQLAAASAAARAGPILLVCPLARPSWAGDGSHLPAAADSWLAAVRQDHQLATPVVPAVVCVRDCPSFGTARPGSGLASVIGHDGRDEVWLDLDRDGPHAIIAGTTGAGKSALLRTLIAGIALAYPPRQVGLVLVDFKGGTSLGHVAGVPHVAGLVSNAQVGAAARALAGLTRQVRERARLLRQWGCTDFRELVALAPGGQLPDGCRVPPRLVIVVDEFRELTVDLPDFLTDLVRVAAQGRSLGIHLILATQRPGGSLSPDIKANMAIKCALRTTSAHESMEIVGTDQAATFTQPGRAVLVTGRDTVVFQVASTQVAPAAPVRRPQACGPGGLGAAGTRGLDAASSGSLDAASSGSPAATNPSSSSARQGTSFSAEWEAALLAPAFRQQAADLRLWAPPVPPAPSCVGWETDRTAIAIGVVDDLSTSSWRSATWHPATGHVGVDGPHAGSALTSLAASCARAGMVVHAIGMDLQPLVPPTHRGTSAPAASSLAVQLVRELLAQPVSDVPHQVLLVAHLSTVQAAFDAGGRRAGELLDQLIRLGPARGVYVIAQTTARSFTVRLDAGQEPERPLDRRTRAAATSPCWLSTPSTTVGCTLFSPQPAPADAVPTPADAAPAPPHPVLTPPLRLVPVPGTAPPLAALLLTGDATRAAQVTTAASDRPVTITPTNPQWTVGLDGYGPVRLQPSSLLVVGPPGAGRTTTLQLLAAQAGTTRGLETLSTGELATFTGTILADDIDLALAANPALDLELSLALPHLTVLASATTERALRDLRGTLATLRTRRVGIVLQPQPADDEVFGTQVWPYVEPGAGPGYAVVVTAGQVRPVRLCAP